MTVISLLALLLFCGVILVVFGALIYLYYKTPDNPPRSSSSPKGWTSDLRNRGI